MTKAKKQLPASRVPAAFKRDPATFYQTITVKEGQTPPDMAAVLARNHLNPAFVTAGDVRRVTKRQADAGLAITELVEELDRQTKAVNAGDLSQGEAMLFAQAHSLQHLYSRLTNAALANMDGGYLDAFERYMRMALRAQNQCRANLETLAAIKTPPVVFARQANITSGPQQVNNDLRAPEREVRQNEVEEAHDLDPGATSTTGRTDPSMAALGALNGTADSSWQGHEFAQRLQGRHAESVATASQDLGTGD